GVSDVVVGDPVYGPADYKNHASAGAADYAILYHWERLPEGLSHTDAAALPMAVETAARYLDWSGLQEDQTVLIHGAGTMVGLAAVQMALLRGAQVVATAGETFAHRLRSVGARVVAHGDGMLERVRAMSDDVPDVVIDVVIDVSPVNLQTGSASVLPTLVELVGGDAARVITIADFAEAAKLGVRTGAENVEKEGGFRLRWDVLGDYGRLAAEDRFFIPVARTFALDAWRDALDISLAGRARGKLVLLPGQ
ncbi:MAG: zinc-binding dehydrogenase, partial [Luteibacter sp.]